MLRRKFSGFRFGKAFLTYFYYPAVSAFHGDRYSGTIHLTRSASRPGYQNAPTWKYTYENGASVSAVMTSSYQGKPQSYRMFFELPRVKIELNTKLPFQSGRDGLVELDDPQFPPEMFYLYDELFYYRTLPGAGTSFDKSYSMGWYGGTVPQSEYYNVFGSTQENQEFQRRYFIGGTIDIKCDAQGISYITSRLSDIVSPQFKQQALAEATQGSFPFSIAQMDDEKNLGYVRGNFELLDFGDELAEVVVAGGVFSGTGAQPYCQFHDLSFVF
jgi:hypothetical protein